MANTVAFTLVSPERHLLTEDVDMVVVPGASGDFGVLPNHAALISTLRPGLLTLYQGDKQRHLFISSGFANVTETSCTVLAEYSEFVEDMNRSQIEKRLQEVKEEMAIARTDSERAELKKVGEMLSLQVELMNKLTKH